MQPHLFILILHCVHSHGLRRHHWKQKEISDFIFDFTYLIYQGYLSSVENSSGQFMVMAMFITTIIWFTCSLLNYRYTLNVQVSFRLLEVIVSFWFCRHTLFFLANRQHQPDSSWHPRRRQSALKMCSLEGPNLTRRCWQRRVLLSAQTVETPVTSF